MFERLVFEATDGIAGSCHTFTGSIWALDD